MKDTAWTVQPTYCPVKCSGESYCLDLQGRTASPAWNNCTNTGSGRSIFSTKLYAAWNFTYLSVSQGIAQLNLNFWLSCIWCLTEGSKFDFCLFIKITKKPYVRSKTTTDATDVFMNIFSTSWTKSYLAPFPLAKTFTEIHYPPQSLHHHLIKKYLTSIPSVLL